VPATLPFGWTTESHPKVHLPDGSERSDAETDARGTKATPAATPTGAKPSRPSESEDRRRTVSLEPRTERRKSRFRRTSERRETIASASRALLAEHGPLAPEQFHGFADVPGAGCVPSRIDNQSRLATPAAGAVMKLPQRIPTCACSPHEAPQLAPRTQPCQRQRRILQGNKEGDKDEPEHERPQAVHQQLSLQAE
jgi:hypothetical protein